MSKFQRLLCPLRPVRPKLITSIGDEEDLDDHVEAESVVGWNELGTEDIGDVGVDGVDVVREPPAKKPVDKKRRVVKNVDGPDLVEHAGVLLRGHRSREHSLMLSHQPQKKRLSIGLPIFHTGDGVNGALCPRC